MAPSLIKAMADPKLFATAFKDAASWSAWRTVLRSLFGLKLADSEMSLFRESTGRTVPFSAPVSEAWLICGRRSGKSYIASLVAVYLAAFRDYSPYLAPGERGTIMILAASRLQARTILRYIAGLLDDVPLLAKLVVARTTESIELSTGVIIEVHTASFRSVRGYTALAVIGDEVAFWRADESANPDKEVLDALRPAMATIPTALLLCLSSPYARRGALYEAFEKHHGNDASDTLVWKAPTEVMNPTISAKVLARAFEDDPAAAAAEYGAEFRGDLSTFLEEQWITAAIDVEVYERPPVQRGYLCFADSSGGKKDSFTVAIAHRQDNLFILDLCREWRSPLNPDSVVAEIASLVRPYRVTQVVGDRYSGEWVIQAFKSRGLKYQPAEVTRSELYLDAGSLLARQSVRLLDQPRLIMQLRQLERRTSIAGRDQVNHPPGGSDDIANAALGAIWLAANRKATVKYEGPPRVAVTDYDEFSHFDEKTPKQRIAHMRDPDYD